MMSGRLHNLDVLRGFAALAVAVHHFTNGNPALLPKGTMLSDIGYYGDLGVAIFFVVSGFVIPHSLRARGYTLGVDSANFLRRRIIRIEAAYLCAALLALAIGAVAALITGDGAKGLSFTSFALHAAYLAPWFDVPWIVPVFWSLAIEFQFYVIMMLAAPLLITNNKNGILIFYGLCGLASLVSTDMRLLCAYIPLFAIGFAQFSIASGMLTRLEGAVVAIAFAAVGWHTLPDHNHVVAALATFAFMFWRPSRPLPFISWVGKISYSLYLVHIPVGGKVIVYAASFTPHVVLQHVAVAVALTLSIAVAWLFWFVIEVGLSAQIARWWPEFVGRAPGVLGVVQPSPSRQ